MKPAYSRDMVALGMELHIHPEILASKMREMVDVPTPRIERIFETYRDNPRRLSRMVKLLRNMKGFNNASLFYAGVVVNETFEREFKPLDESGLTIVALILILDLYFRLTPVTMVVETPEIIELAKMLKVKPQVVVEAMHLFRCCDPCLNRSKKNYPLSKVAYACKEVWQRYAQGGEIGNLEEYARKLSEYYK